MAICKNNDMFYPDYVNVSVIGHCHVYFAIMNFVKEAVDTGYEPSSAKQSTWVQGDLCSAWYTDRVILHVVYASSTGLAHHNDGGHIKVKNLFDGPRHLILLYMATGPAPSKYPIVDITVGTLQGH
eukprot:14379540-Ditylum_brightwellii.AAC.1